MPSFNVYNILLHTKQPYINASLTHLKFYLKICFDKIVTCRCDNEKCIFKCIFTHSMAFMEIV